MKTTRLTMVLMLSMVGTTGCPDTSHHLDADHNHNDLKYSNLRSDRPAYTVASVQGTKPICVLTQYTANCDNFASVAAVNHEEYAAAHGYHYFRFRGRVSGEGFTDPESTGTFIFRQGLYWQKLAATRYVLQQQAPGLQTPLCDWVMWVDSDVLFTNFTRTVETVMAPYADMDVILSREQKGYPGTHINSGVYFVRNNAAGNEFVNDIANMYPTYKNWPLPDQDAIQDWAFQARDGSEDRNNYEALRRGLRSHVGLAPQRLFNAFYQPEEVSQEFVHWQPCDFIAHFAGVGHVERGILMREVAKNLGYCAY